MTAVEYYNQEIKELFNQFQDGEISGNMFHVQRLAALTQAQEMEKQDIINAFVACWEANTPDGIECKLSAVDYYKTFKSK